MPLPSAEAAVGAHLLTCDLGPTYVRVYLCLTLSSCSSALKSGKFTTSEEAIRPEITRDIFKSNEEYRFAVLDNFSSIFKFIFLFLNFIFQFTNFSIVPTFNEYVKVIFSRKLINLVYGDSI